MKLLWNTTNKIVRTQRLILTEFGREATPEELAKKFLGKLSRAVSSIVEYCIDIAGVVGA